MERTLEVVGALWYSLPFGVLGLLALLAAAFFWRRTRRFIRESVWTHGEVVGLRENIDDGSPVYAPVIRYAAGDGAERQFVHHTASRPPSYSVGQRVAILYRRGRPEEARMADGTSLYMDSIIFALVGAVFFFVALLAPLAALAGFFVAG